MGESATKSQTTYSTKPLLKRWKRNKQMFQGVDKLIMMFMSWLRSVNKCSLLQLCMCEICVLILINHIWLCINKKEKCSITLNKVEATVKYRAKDA